MERGLTQKISTILLIGGEVKCFVKKTIQRFVKVIELNFKFNFTMNFIIQFLFKLHFLKFNFLAKFWKIHFTWLRNFKSLHPFQKLFFIIDQFFN